MRDLVTQEDDVRIEIDREAFLGHHEAVRARIVREVAGRLGATLGESGTRSALAFTSAGASGHEHPISGTVRVIRSFDRLVFCQASVPGADRTFDIQGPGDGRGVFSIGGRDWSVTWSLGPKPLSPWVEPRWVEPRWVEPRWVERFSVSGLEFPVTLRGWRSGDRMKHSYGSKKLKKIFGEKRVGLEERSQAPVVVDGKERILWIPGVARSSLFLVGCDDDALTMSVSRRVVTRKGEGSTGLQ